MFRYNSTWSFDIDGTLTQYPKEWLEYISKKSGKLFLTTEEARKALKSDYEILKHSYRISDDKYQIKIDKNFKNFIKKIKINKGKVIIATSRPFNKYIEMKNKTIKWLKSNNINFDILISKSILYKFDYDIHIDDDLSQIRELKKINAYYILINKQKKYQMNKKFPTRVTLVNSIEEINVI